MTQAMLANDLPTGTFPTPTDLDHLADALHARGFAVLDSLLPAELVDALFIEARTKDAEAYTRAGTGREQAYRTNRFVRTDEIAWLDRAWSEAESQFLGVMERLRAGLNERLLLGLFDYEAHFAHYPEGAFYRKHYDAFRGQRNRVLSTVLYLNPAWQSSDAGALRLFDPADDTRELLTLLPQYGRLVIFLSEEFAHEVLPTNRARYSIAGWFRVNNSLAIADPPA